MGLTHYSSCIRMQLGNSESEDAIKIEEEFHRALDNNIIYFVRK